MEIIDAFWEKENLGIDVVEVICNHDDCGNKLEAELNKISVPYSVLKIPAGNYELLCAGQKNGYFVVEASFKLIGDIRKAKLPSVYNRFIPYLKVKEAENEIREKIFSEIGNGKIFSTDRIALDPIFSKELAGRRYYNWGRDVINKGASLDVAYYKNIPVAFNINSHPDDKHMCKGILGGMFSEAMDRGLGFLVLYTELESCKRLGGKAVITTVSSNNLPIFRLYLQYGFDIKEMNYVLIKHQ